jgi:hypothetical protein
MINWHRLAHWLGLNSWFSELTVDKGSIVSRQHCTKCDETRNTLILCPVDNMDLNNVNTLCKIFNGWKE